MSGKRFTCGWCAAECSKPTGEVNRAINKGAPLYCNRECAGLARRSNKDAAQLVAEKAAYDTRYRGQNAAKLKASKAAYYAATVDREKERISRKARMHLHVEYCRRPEYKLRKTEYDKSYRARKWFGDFGEAAILLNELEAEITTRASWLDRARDKGTLNKHQNRRREYDRQTQRS